ncbi:MAG: SusC/RagA family TonB-linked outer membrane protein [Bacteroidales bacterium]|nr:SusC/RagA family TonB-linked outer membrane protein [Bacteroidales bacterium]
MRKSLFLFACFLLASIGLVCAQSKSVTGKVLSAEDGQPIIGATVMIKGSNIGSMTDEQGNFALKASIGSKLVFTYVGMVTTEVNATEKMVVRMQSSERNLEEVVVTAMGITRTKKSLGYAASSVSGKELTESRRSDVMTALSGKIAGVQISSAAGDPGSSNSVIIRGITSLSGSNQPLYIIDGVPMNNSAVFSDNWLDNAYDYGNGANMINPEDVASMTILKGAASTALYGSRAANGVVLITTKSGSKQNKGVGVEYNGGLQWSTLLRLPDFQNEFGMGWDGTHTLIENGSWGPKMDGSLQLWGNIYKNSQKLKTYSPMENNLKDFFDTGFRYSNSISFNGATDKSDYFVSFSQLSDDGLIPTDVDTYDKYTFSFRASHTTGNLKLSTSMNYADQTNNFTPTGQGLSMINSLYQVPRDVSIVGMKDLTDPFNTLDYFFTPYGITNPYWLIENVENTYNQKKLYGKMQAEYKILHNLTATYRLGIDVSNSLNKQGSPKIVGTVGTPNEDKIDQSGSFVETSTRRQELNHEFLLNYNKGFNDFNVTALLGANINERTYSEQESKLSSLDIPTFYNLSNSGSAPVVSEYSYIRRLIGGFGNVEVDYKNLLFLNLSARNDWSSTLPKANNSFFYPGTTVSFVFSELLPENIKKTVSFGKLRLAYGKTGNDANVYMIAPCYRQSKASTSFGYNSFPLNGINAFTLYNVLGNDNLSPEITTEYEVGMNVAFLNGRIDVDASYYNRNSDKQIFSLNMDPASGYSAQNMNLGKISNKGIEMLVNLKVINEKDFKWNLSWNYTKNNSEIVSLPEELGGEALLEGFSSTHLVAQVGKPIGIKTYRALKDEEGHIVVNPNTGLPQKSDKMEYIGKIDYDYEMGITNAFTYKNVTLGFDIDIRQGGLMYSRTKELNYFVGNAIQTAYNDRNPFIIPGSVVENEDGTYSENTVAISVANQGEYWTEGACNMGSDFLIDKSYVKLRSVTLAYDLPKSLINKVGFITDARISAFGSNLLLWTPVTNSFIDPEVSSLGNDLSGKFGEFSANPTTRKFGFNLMLKF